MGRIVQGRPRFLPCTPQGIQQLLIRNNIQIAGANVVVLGRSEIVGKPMAIMLMQRSPGGDATVTVCHSRTKNLPEICRLADILIVAIGKAKFVTADMVKPGATVIDVGINRTEAGLVGDVDFESVKEVAGLHHSRSRRHRPADHRHAAEEHPAGGEIAGTIARKNRDAGTGSQIPTSTAQKNTLYLKRANRTSDIGISADWDIRKSI